MIESHIKYTDLEKIEPMLKDLTFTQFTLQGIVDEARVRLVAIIENRLPNRGADLKKLCNRLSLVLDTKSNQDLVGRRRLVIQMSSIDSDSFKLESSADGTTWNSQIDTIQVDNTEVNGFLIEDADSYYKLTRLAGNGTVNKAYMVETSFELPHTYLALSMAFRRLQATADDTYKQQADYYEDEFNKALNNLNYSFDSDGDGSITSDDTKIANNVVRILG